MRRKRFRSEQSPQQRKPQTKHMKLLGPSFADRSRQIGHGSFKPHVRLWPFFQWARWQSVLQYCASWQRAHFLHGVLGARTSAMLAPLATALQYQQTYGPPRTSISAIVSQVLESSLKLGMSFRMCTPLASIDVTAMFMVLCARSRSEGVRTWLWCQLGLPGATMSMRTDGATRCAQEHENQKDWLVSYA